MFPSTPFGSQGRCHLFFSSCEFHILLCALCAPALIRGRRLPISFRWKPPFTYGNTIVVLFLVIPIKFPVSATIVYPFKNIACNSDHNQEIGRASCRERV